MSGIWEHQEESSIAIQLVRADKGKRLANFLIDLVISTIFAVVVFMIIAFVLEMVGIDAFAAIERMHRLTDQLLTLLMRVLYYFIFETALNGRSIGKIITGTQAVTLDGELPSLSTFIKRSFSRIVPFEPFSYLGEGDGWHDRWTDTMVIDLKHSVLPEIDDTEAYEY